MIKIISNARFNKRIKKIIIIIWYFNFVKLKVWYYFLLFFSLKIVLFFPLDFLIIFSDDSFVLLVVFYFFHFFYVPNGKRLFKWVNPKNLIIIVLLISIPYGLGLVDYGDLIYNVLCRKVLLLKFLFQNQNYNNYDPLEMLILIIIRKKKILILIC